MPSNSAMRRSSSGAVPAGPDHDVEVRRAQQLHAGLANVLRNQDPHAATTQSMHAVSASTSAGSIAGNIPIRS